MSQGFAAAKTRVQRFPSQDVSNHAQRLLPLVSGQHGETAFESLGDE